MRVRDASGTWSLSIHKGNEKIIDLLKKEYPDLEYKKGGIYYNLNGEISEDVGFDSLLYKENKRAEDEYFIRTFIDFDDADELRT